MISQEKRLIITFRCTTDAIAMEKSCKATGAPGRLIPVPRSISASCGPVSYTHLTLPTS